MKNDKENRLRLLCIFLLLLSEADAEHPMSTYELIDRLWERFHIKVHRMTIPKDLELLKEVGCEVVTVRTKGHNFYIANRPFELAELKLMIDAVEASRFITPSKTKMLEKKLISFASIHQAQNLERGLLYFDKVKSENIQGMMVVDSIHKAINSGRQISFYYSDYSIKRRKVLKNGRKPYVVSPYKLIWNGDYYYLVGWNHQREQVNVFRVDRIVREPEILKADSYPLPKKFDLTRYTTQVFRMYANEDPVEVALLCDASVMKGMIDKFGPRINTNPISENQFIARVSVCTSPTFYSWVFQWDGKIQIVEPQSIVDEYQERLRRQIKQEK